MYDGHQPSGPGDAQGSIKFLVASPIPAGADVVLTATVPPPVGPMMFTASSSAIEETTKTLYVQADSTGAVSEPDDGNNISAPTAACFASSDTFEPDNDATAAKPVEVNAPGLTHNADIPGDEDWVSFTAEAGKGYDIRTVNLVPSADTVLYLYDTDATTLLASNDDSNETLASEILWTAPQSGTYVVKVTHWNPNAGGCGTSYDLAISFASLDSDSDAITDASDNCPAVANPDQFNSDGGLRSAGSQIPGGWASNPAADKLGNACDPDSHNDGLPDSQEYVDHCPYRLVADSDGDRIMDGFEAANGSDPCNPASKPLCTDTADSDNDGLTNCIEHAGYNTGASTNDTVPGWSTCAVPMDSDSDGCADVLEVMDINGDRKVSVGDQTLLAKRGVGIVPPSDSDPVFDVNKDGKITVADQTLMAKNTCNLKPWLLGCSTGVCPAE